MDMSFFMSGQNVFLNPVIVTSHSFEYRISHQTKKKIRSHLVISTNRFMETIFKTQPKTPSKSLHNQVAASKAPEIWLAADSMKLDSSSSGRITKPQRWGLKSRHALMESNLTYRYTRLEYINLGESRESAIFLRGWRSFLRGKFWRNFNKYSVVASRWVLKNAWGPKLSMGQGLEKPKNIRMTQVTMWSSKLIQPSKHLELHEPLRIANDLPL